MTTERFQQTGHAVVRYLMPVMLVLAAVLAGCANPMGSSTSSGGTTDRVGGGAPTPITITFVLDTDTGGGFSLSTSATAPAPIAATAGVPVRLTQGIGFTAEATGAGPGGSSVTYHASGWSTEPYSTQFPKIFDSGGPAPSGTGYYLPGFEATFTENTTLYARWLPEFDNIAAQVTYHEPGNVSNTTAGPILHVRDQVPFETTAQFVARVSPSWTVVENHGIYEWRSVERDIFQPRATGPEPAVWQFYTGNFFEGHGDSGLRNITLSYTTRPVWTVTLDYNGATGGIGDLTRVAYDNVEARLNPGWDYIAPTRDGLRFGGWWTARDSGGEVWSNGASDIFSASPAHTAWFTTVQTSFQRKVTSDMTLYARWIADVEFNTNGGSEVNGGGDRTQSVYVNDGASPSVFPPALDAAYDHDVFLGWYSDSELTTLVPAVSSYVPVSQSGTLFAGWGPDPQYAVGQTGPGGGIVFYIKDGTDARATLAQDWRFLEVAPDDIDGKPGYTGRATWGLHVDSAKRTVSTDPAHDSLGGGFESTASLLTQRPGGETNNAAYQASEYSNGGKTDWYLPSVAELLQLANIWTDAGLTSGFGSANLYWASTSYEGRGFAASTEGSPTAMGVRRSSLSGPLSVELQQRNNHSRVRPVRRF
ncbi:InlB B-repeat-containing protein [Alkalispirochaeta sphaeroplastigenens]|uniref:InlB B-repeat-containing protein n=1 Tax=Alkalispirochaeta sphaeroplastigenens TaxID=1187066 RepID=UPI0011AF689D|nr:InlB B-repeat-containing protein [Alkalispirochaeta sphaeroplastigenens]